MQLFIPPAVVPVVDKRSEAARIAKQVADWKARGNKVEFIPRGVMNDTPSQSRRVANEASMKRRKQRLSKSAAVED